MWEETSNAIEQFTGQLIIAEKEKRMLMEELNELKRLATHLQGELDALDQSSVVDAALSDGEGSAESLPLIPVPVPRLALYK